jgi:hypothetical protein
MRGKMMFSKIRTRFTYANVAMTLALVFAMSGGAYAAKHYVITSTKQISPTVLKKFTGKTGATGPEGKQGAAGPAGKDAINGKEGPQGPQGLEGKEGKAGKEGKEGKTGAPWPAGGTLPSASTETGQWALFTTSAKTEELRVATISFPIPMASIPNVVLVRLGETAPAECEGGTAAEPKAKPGELCVFEGESVAHAGGLRYAGDFDGSGAVGVGKTGVDLAFGTKATGEVSAEGSWAVTEK